MMLLADLFAVLHGILVLYVAGGVVAILLGLWRKWRWTRRFWFRFTHLMICLAVVLFELAAQPCPLTSAERYFRDQAAPGSGYAGGFIAHYVSETIHFQVPPQMMAGPMLGVVALVVLLYRWAGPEAGRGERESAAAGGASSPGPPTVRHRAWRYVLLLLFVAGALPLLGLIAGGAWSGRHRSLAFLVLGLILCLPRPWAAGLRLGETECWRKRSGWIAVLWALPPLFVILAYAIVADRPSKGIAWDVWLLDAIAGELIFLGFVYSTMVKWWGEEREAWRGVLSWPVAGTALAYGLAQWPSVRDLSAGYMAAYVICTFFGALLWLQMRRWTGSLLPSVTSHAVAGYFASVL